MSAARERRQSDLLHFPHASARFISITSVRPTPCSCQRSLGATTSRHRLQDHRAAHRRGYSSRERTPGPEERTDCVTYLSLRRYDIHCTRSAYVRRCSAQTCTPLPSFSQRLTHL